MVHERLARRWPAWVTLAVALLLVTGLIGCRSTPKKVAGNPAPQLAEPTYVPAPPPMPATPSVSPAELAEATGKYQAERNRAESLEEQLRYEQQRAVEAEARAAEVEERLTELSTPPAGEGAPPALEETPVDTVAILADELRARSANEVLREGDLVIVRVSNAFRPGSDLLKKDVQLVGTLNATADALSRYPGATVAVVGHSDTDKIQKSADRWKSNGELSLARARRVAQVLSDNGVASSRISVDGRGAAEPLVFPERGSADKARNRRVEILIRL